jgi:hypothetical protein
MIDDLSIDVVIGSLDHWSESSMNRSMDRSSIIDSQMERASPPSELALLFAPV